jgi:uncharacterized NAD(P)/FAD-binding protein YdhS
MTTIAIVGAGFSGTMLALHLLGRSPPPVKLVLIERASQFGLGPAYSTGNPSHLLNVPAAGMSAFHDRPGDFLNWLASQPDAATFDRGSFAPRRTFGNYLRALLHEAVESAGPDRLELLPGDVIALDRTTTPLTLTLDQGRSLRADFVVLAIGNFPSQPIPVVNPEFYDTALYRPDPWAADALTGLDKEVPVLLLGTGLTMIDATVSLLDQGHRGPIHAVSRRGLLPRRHATVQTCASEPAPFPTSVLALMRLLRLEAKRAAGEGAGWQPVIDALRPFTADIWRAMTPSDRARFLRHARPWWDVHRHRMASGVADRTDAARASGQLRIIAGRVREYVTKGGLADVVYKPRGQDRLAMIEAARVINCVGPGADYDRIPDPLIRTLLRDGVVRPDAFLLGLDVTANCALLNRDGAISRRLFAVGPVTKGTFWEMVAVPDIRRQAEELAQYMARLVPATPTTYPPNVSRHRSMISGIPSATSCIVSVSSGT